MQFEWDAAKSKACAQLRGFNFDYAARAFGDPMRLVEPDNRHDYGETRYRLLGQIEGRLFVVVYTPRQEALRIISARKANQRETRRYEASTQNH